MRLALEAERGEQDARRTSGSSPRPELGEPRIELRR